MYAYAVLGHHPGAELLSAIAKGVQWQLRDFSPQVTSSPWTGSHSKSEIESSEGQGWHYRVDGEKQGGGVPALMRH